MVAQQSSSSWEMIFLSILTSLGIPERLALNLSYNTNGIRLPAFLAIISFIVFLVSIVMYTRKKYLSLHDNATQFCKKYAVTLIQNNDPNTNVQVLMVRPK